MHTCLKVKIIYYVLEMQQYIDISPYRDTLSQWYSIGTI